MNYIVVDIGGTKTLFVYISKSITKFEIINSKKVITPKSKYFIIEHLKQLDSFIKENNIIKYKLRYSICGPVKNNYIFSMPNLNVHDLELKKYVEGFFSKKIDVRLENDVNCFALGIYNSFKKTIKDSSFFCLNLGTGIGGSYINDRKLFVGNSGNFAEIGREIFNKEEREDFLSKTLKLIHKLRLEIVKKNKLELNTFKDYLEFVKKYKLKENETINKIDNYFFENFLELILSIEKLYDPKFIFIGGSLVYYLDYLIEKFGTNEKYLTTLRKINILNLETENTANEESIVENQLLNKNKIKYISKKSINHYIGNLNQDFKNKLKYINYTKINYNIYGAINLNNKSK